MSQSNIKEQITDIHKNMDESLSQTLHLIKEAVPKRILERELYYLNMNNI